MILSVSILATLVSGHATVLSFGTKDRTTRPRAPQVVFRGDQGPTTNTGNRCVQNSSYVDYADRRVANWCKSSDLWTGNGQYKGLMNATVDEGYCLGSIPGSFMNTESQGQLTGVPRQYMGSKKTQAFCPGDKIEVWTGVGAFHYGTHFIDMVPQSAEQIRGMQQCPNGDNVKWISSDRMKNYPLPCYDPNANPVPAASGDLKGNRIFGEFSGQQFMVKTEFELPHEVKFEAGPIIFRWLWFCGVDVCNGERQAWGMGELFHACMDARISNTCGAPPAPTTQGPTTEVPSTTSAPETTTQRPRPTLPPRPTTEAPTTTKDPEKPCKPVTTTEAPVTTTEAPETTTQLPTTEAPVTTEAPTTDAPEETQCRRWVNSRFPTTDEWCANSCVMSVGETLMWTMCCAEADESLCHSNSHCYCPQMVTRQSSPVIV